MGPAAVDIQTLFARHGILAYDPGFRSTASCKSAITFVDGDNGVLLYRGYPIEELAEHSTFDEARFRAELEEGSSETTPHTHAPGTPSHQD